MSGRPSFTQPNGSRITFSIPADWFLTISAVSRRTYRQNVLIETSDGTRVHMTTRNARDTGSMQDSNLGLLSFPVAPFPDDRELEVFFSFSTANRSLTIQQLKSPEFSCHRAVVRSASTLPNTSSNIPEYANFFVYVADTVENSQTAPGVQFDDMLLVISVVTTNPNEIPPPPPDNVVRPYNPILDRPRPSTLENYLKEYEVHFLVDDSSSMSSENRWEEARNALVGLSHATFDANFVRDGIDISFLNNAAFIRGLLDRNEVEALFRQVNRPNGGTPTGRRCSEILNAHIDILDNLSATPAYAEVKPLNLIVITDGVPDGSPPEFILPTVLVGIGARLRAARHHPNSLGVQFVQIGSDPAAAIALPLLLQADTGHIVDTVPWLGPGSLSATRLERILLGALHPNIRALHAQRSFNRLASRAVQSEADKDTLILIESASRNGNEQLGLPIESPKTVDSDKGLGCSG